MPATHGPLGLVFSACFLPVAGCSVDLSPVEPVLSATRVEIADQDHHDLRVEAPADSHVLVTVSSRDVDVRAAIARPGDAHESFADAPNRRMGIETLLVEPPHEQALSIRIERNDHGEARGFVTVDAVALPVTTDADLRRLKAAKLESAACLQFSDLTKGAETAAAYAAAADLHEKNGDHRRAGIALLHAAGARYTRLADWGGAADLAARAWRELGKADAPELAAIAMRLEGAALDLVADASDEEPKARDRLIAQARQRLTEASKRLEALGLSYEAGYALNYRGVSFQKAGERDRARADFQQALGLFRAARDKPAQALSLQSLATLSHQEGRLVDAIREFDTALTLIPRDEEQENYAHTLHNSAQPLRVLGRFDEAIARYHEAGQILRQLGDRDGEARALHGMGTTLKYAGEPERARELLHAAVELRNETGAKREQAVSLFVLGQIERDEGRISVAIALHNQAAALVSAPHDRVQALLALAQDHVAAGDLATARRQLDETLRLNLPATHRYLGLALTELGVVESLAGKSAAADDAFARAIAVHKANGSDLEQARTLYRRAEAKMRLGNTRSVLADTSAALRLFDEVGVQGTQAEGRASFRATYRGAIELRIAAFLADAEAAQQRGDSGQAQRLLRTAFTTSDRSRAQLLTDGRASTYNGQDASPELLARRGEIYELLAGKRQRQERLLDAAAPDAQQLAMLSKDIALLRAEVTLVESGLAKSQAGSPRSVTTDADEQTQVVPSGVLVAEYFLGDKHSWLFAVRDGAVAVHTLPGTAEIEKLARQLHLSWRSPANAMGDHLAVSRKLAALILGPLGKSVSGKEPQIIPDGALHLVPMAVLAQEMWPDMRPGAAIIIPSLSAMRFSNQRQSAIADKLLAVIADPVYSTNDPRIHAAVNEPAQKPSIRLAGNAPLTRSAHNLYSLQRLPSTAVEAREIINLVNNPSETLTLIGPDANRLRVTTAPLDQYRIVHFATHAMADSQDPALATLALSRWDAEGRPVDGALRRHDITQMRLNADLVVLSGCDTALGREIAGEGPIGLSQAFLRIGARSVVSTLWQVPDSSTAVLMREFYRQLLTNERDAPVALQLAQEHVRRQARWSDPYFWAGFQLVSMARIVRNDNVE